MKRLLIIIGIVIICLPIWLSGCTTQNNSENQDNSITDTEKSKFVGIWENDTMNFTTTLQFFSDGTFAYLNYTGTWDLKQGRLEMDFKTLGLNWTKIYEFSNNNRELSLTFPTGGKTQVFIKK